MNEYRERFHYNPRKKKIEENTPHKEAEEEKPPEVRNLQRAMIVGAFVFWIAALGIPSLFGSYDGYAVVRWVISLICIYAMNFFRRSDKIEHLLGMLMLLVAFNPLKPLPLPYYLWIAIDMGASLYFLGVADKVEKMRWFTLVNKEGFYNFVLKDYREEKTNHVDVQ